MPCCSYAAFLWGLEDQLNVLLFVPCSSGPRDASTLCEMPIALSQVDHAALHLPPCGSRMGKDDCQARTSAKEPGVLPPCNTS